MTDRRRLYFSLSLESRTISYCLKEKVIH